MNRVRPIRALWFADVQTRPRLEQLGLPSDAGAQAWVDSLREALESREDVSLAVATPSGQQVAPVKIGRTTYFTLPLSSPTSRAGRIVANWQHDGNAAATLAAARKLVRSYRPDLVHVHGTEGVVAAVAVSVAPTPTVISLQGILHECQRFYFAGRSKSDLAVLPFTGDFLKGRGPLHGYWRMRRLADRELEIMRAAQFFIGRTEWDRRVLEAVNPTATYFHGDEVMRPPFYSAIWNRVEASTCRIYSTSSSMGWKGTECLLEAASMLVREGLTDLAVRIAGVPAGSALEAYYRRTAQRLHLESYVDWLGRLSAAAIASELQAADVFVYPSHMDNSPNALVEAMLVGTPIAASFTGGIPTLVRDQEEGVLFPRGDARALAHALRGLFADRLAAARLGHAARMKALRRNDPSAIAARTIEIYDEVIARSTMRRAGGDGW